jgi:hypothetical protein
VAGGTVLDPGVACSEDACVEPSTDEACCVPNVGCVEIDPVFCATVTGGTPQGPGSTCDTESCNPPCEGDVNNDGIVDIDDLVLVILDFGMVGPGLPTDINGDMMVTIDDVVALVVNFGPCDDA